MAKIRSFLLWIGCWRLFDELGSHFYHLDLRPIPWPLFGMEFLFHWPGWCISSCPSAGEPSSFCQLNILASNFFSHPLPCLCYWRLGGFCEVRALLLLRLPNSFALCDIALFLFLQRFSTTGALVSHFTRIHGFGVMVTRVGLQDCPRRLFCLELWMCCGLPSSGSVGYARSLTHEMWLLAGSWGRSAFHLSGALTAKESGVTLNFSRASWSLRGSAVQTSPLGRVLRRLLPWLRPSLSLVLRVLSCLSCLSAPLTSPSTSLQAAPDPVSAVLLSFLPNLLPAARIGW